MSRPARKRSASILQDLATLTVSPGGTVTIPTELIEDLGLRPGDQVTVDNLFGEHLALTPTDRKGPR